MQAKAVLTALALAASATKGDVVCNNPNAQPLFTLPAGVTGAVLHQRIINGPAPPYETPIFARLGMIGAYNYPAALNVYDGYSLDYMTGVRPAVVADYTLSGTQLWDLSIAASYYARGVLYLLNGFPASSSSTVAYMHSVGFLLEPGTVADFNEWAPDFLACLDEPDEGDRDDCLRDVLTYHCFSPQYVGYLVAYRNNATFTDGRVMGFNPFGTEEPNGGHCTANCKPYSDSVGYVPRNVATSMKPIFKVKHNGDWTIKLNGNNKYWAPLLETNNLGFFYRQEHVTPQIGFKGEMVGADQEFFTQGDKCNVASRFGVCTRLDDPAYDYGLEAQLAIERVNAAGTDQVMKMKIEYFDRKDRLLTLIGNKLYELTNNNVGHIVNWHLGVSAAVVDAVKVVWREKVMFDKIRPTTLVQSLGDFDIEAWAGPYKGIETIKAKNWQPYIRVMPHSEFPSGSACICQAITEFSRLFVQQRLGIEDLELTFTFPPGSSTVEPGLPEESVTLSWNSLAHLQEECGQSRLWGGMHFTTSVPVGQSMCTGIGAQTFHKIQVASALE